METDLNSMIVTVGYTVLIFGGLSALVVGHYYSRKASSKNKLTQAEFNRGIIIFTVACFVSVAGIGCAQLILHFLEPEPVSVIEVIVISLFCLGLPPLVAAGVFMWEFRRKGWVEKEK